MTEDEAMERKSPSPRAFFANLRKPMPPREKWRKFVRNVGIRLTGKSCCGHFGEPGC